MADAAHKYVFKECMSLLICSFLNGDDYLVFRGGVSNLRKPSGQMAL